jgi:exosortase
LIAYASNSEFLSYIPLVPCVTCALLFMQRRSLPSERHVSIAGALSAGAVGVAAASVAIAYRGRLSVNDTLTLLTTAYVCTLIAGAFLFLGSTWMRAALFPVAFLAFMIPLPDAIVASFERASVVASADVAAWFFTATGTPLLRDGTHLAIPGIVLVVAQECSGIHSSWILLITSLLAAWLFVEGGCQRAILVALVLPLAIVRNAFRILVVGLLCAHFGPQMIDSPIHRRGGPLFFALSLIPLFAAMWWLRRDPRPAMGKP